MGEPTEKDYRIAVDIAMACSWCAMPWNACSDKREAGQRQSLESTGEALEDDEGFCCEECCHSSRARDPIASALAAAREEGRRAGIEEAAGACRPWHTSQEPCPCSGCRKGREDAASIRALLSSPAPMEPAPCPTCGELSRISVFDGAPPCPTCQPSPGEPSCKVCGGACPQVGCAWPWAEHRPQEPAPTSKLSHICAEDFHCCALSSAHECLACKHERPAPATEPACSECDGPCDGYRRPEPAPTTEPAPCETCGDRGLAHYVKGEAVKPWDCPGCEPRPCPACRPQETKP